eukprot:547390-Pleurochrysis_carterae.AAC.2
MQPRPAPRPTPGRPVVRARAALKREQNADLPVRLRRLLIDRRLLIVVLDQRPLGVRADDLLQVAPDQLADADLLTRVAALVALAHGEHVLVVRVMLVRLLGRQQRPHRARRARAPHKRGRVVDEKGGVAVDPVRPVTRAPLVVAAAARAAAQAPAAPAPTAVASTAASPTADEAAVAVAATPAVAVANVVAVVAASPRGTAAKVDAQA